MLMRFGERSFTDVEQGRLLRALRQGAALSPEGARNEALALVLLRFGLRIGECVGLTAEDARLALRLGYLFIDGRRRKGGQRADADGRRRPKTDLVSHLTAPKRAALQAALAARRAFTAEDDGPLFQSREGGALTARAFQMAFKRVCLEAGLPPQATPHWLRHTRGQTIMEQSTAADPRGLVQRELGHADIRSSGCYSGMSRARYMAAVEALDGPPKLRRRDVARFVQGGGDARHG